MKIEELGEKLKDFKRLIEIGTNRYEQREQNLSDVEKIKCSKVKEQKFWNRSYLERRESVI